MTLAGRSTAALGIHTLLSRLVIYVSAFVASVLVARGLGPSGNGLDGPVLGSVSSGANYV